VGLDIVQQTLETHIMVDDPGVVLPYDTAIVMAEIAQTNTINFLLKVG
jgi:hypothetical protein